MQTLTGHYYQVELELQGSLAVSSDWLPSPLSQRYPVEVISVSQAAKQADGTYRSTVVLKWIGDRGLIEDGDAISSDLNYVSPIPVGIGASAVVVSVLDLGTTVSSAGASFTNYVLALGIVAFTVVMARMVKPERRAAA